MRNISLDLAEKFAYKTGPTVYKIKKIIKKYWINKLLNPYLVMSFS